MKNYLFTLLLAAISLFNAQISDLAELSNGTISNFQPIYDTNDQLYGYLVMYNLDKIDAETQKFEYVFLDKNLNQVSNNEFTSNLLVSTYYGYIGETKKLIIAPYFTYSFKDLFRANNFPPTYEVNFKNNEIAVKKGICYENNEFIECEADKKFNDLRKEERNERKEKGFSEISEVKEFEDGSLIVYQYKSVGKNYLNNYPSDNKFMRFDALKNKLWEYTFNEDANKKNLEIMHLLDWDGKTAFFILQNSVKKKNSYSFVVFNLELGEIETTYNLDAEIPDFTMGYYVDFQSKKLGDYKFNSDDYFKVIGDYFVKNDVLGYYSIQYDKSTKKTSIHKLMYSSLEGKLDINKKGYVENNYRLQFRDIYFLKDGSVGILTEKGKFNTNTGKLKTTDLVGISTDKNFNPVEVKIFDKEKSKGFRASDYLFSQYINDGKDVVFFYKDLEKDEETKDKNWNLYINTIIEGKFKQEVIPISSEDNSIYPYVAKEGYILLREFNEKEKYNQIRLERLNY